MKKATAALFVLMLLVSCGSSRNPREFMLRVRTVAVGFSTREDLSQVYGKACLDAILNGTRFTVDENGTIGLKTSSVPLSVPAAPAVLRSETEKLPNGFFVTRIPAEFAASIRAAGVYKIEGKWTIRPGDNSGFVNQIFLDEVKSLHDRRPAVRSGWIYMTDVDFKVLRDGGIEVRYRGLITEGES